jgi:hypothetical protein
MSWPGVPAMTCFLLSTRNNDVDARDKRGATAQMWVPLPSFCEQITPVMPLRLGGNSITGGFFTEASGLHNRIE